MRKNCKKLVQKNSEQKKYLKEKVINCMSNGKDTIINLMFGLIKKTSYKNESILPKPFRSFGGNINVKVGLSNYATTTDPKKCNTH